MFKVQNRVESQTINTMAKRMGIAVIKRSHEIYSNTFAKGSTISDLSKPGIREDDDADLILEKTLDALHDETSAADFSIIDNPFSKPHKMTNENHDIFYHRPEYEHTTFIDSVINKRSL
jgi:hypothetical protein